LNKEFKADLLLLTITALWGPAFILIKNILDDIPIFAYLSLRFILAAVVLILIYKNRLKKITREMAVHGFWIGIMLFGGMTAQIVGLSFTTASNTAFISGMNVVFIPIISAFYLHKTLSSSSIIGVLLAFTGLFFLTGGIDLNFNLGDWLVLLGALCYTIQIFLIDKYTNSNDPIVLAIIQLSVTAILHTGVWLSFNFQPIIFNSNVIMTIIFTGVICTAFAFAGQNIAQKSTSPTHTALIFTTEPLFGAAAAMIIPNSQGITETLGVNVIVGGILILSGMLISEFHLINPIDYLLKNSYSKLYDQSKTEG